MSQPDEVVLSSVVNVYKRPKIYPVPNPPKPKKGRGKIYKPFVEPPEFVAIPRPEKNALELLRHLVTKTPETETQFLVPKISWDALKSLIPPRWINDEIVDFAMQNIDRLFCGERSTYRTFIFPHNFITRVANLGHDAFEGFVDHDVARNWTDTHAKNCNLTEYDNIIIVTNPGSMHWTIIVVFPKLKRIEHIDSMSQPGTDMMNYVWQWWAIYSKENGKRIRV